MKVNRVLQRVIVPIIFRGLQPYLALYYLPYIAFDIISHAPSEKAQEAWDGSEVDYKT